MSKDYYKTLDIDKKASTDEIKKAYKKKALKYHPDRNKGDKEAEKNFKEINEAYQVLSDSNKKSQYDQFGATDFNGGNASGFSGRQGFGGFDFSQGEGFDDIFSSFFGGGRSRGPRRGSDIEIIIPLKFEESIFGVEKEISYSVIDNCEKCGGRGGENMTTCSQCGGSGKISKTTRTILGSFAQTVICPTCRGKGEEPKTKCSVCGGNGTTRQKKNIKVKIPEGVNNNSSIKIAGGGEAGDGGNGDLYLRIKVESHKEFTRSGMDIYSEEEISFSKATLGGKVDINTVYGPVRLTIPAGTQSHTEFVLRGKGVPHPLRKTKGNHHVLIKVKVPKKISRKEKEMLEELNKENSDI